MKKDEDLLKILKYIIRKEYTDYCGYCCKSNYNNGEFLKVLYTLIKEDL